MSSSIVRLYGKRAPTKKQIDRAVWVRKFTQKKNRPPNLSEVAKRFKISIPTAWETMQRINKNDGTCPMCGARFTNK